MLSRARAASVSVSVASELLPDDEDDGVSLKPDGGLYVIGKGRDCFAVRLYVPRCNGLSSASELLSE